MGAWFLGFLQIIIVMMFAPLWCSYPPFSKFILNNFDLNPHRGLSKVVFISSGAIQGSRDSDGSCEAFFGLPYAKPPVGHRRFMRPESVADLRWSGIRPARMTGSMCTQRSLVFASSPIVGNEDCLYLNVYRPGNVDSDSALPVMVFIPGGLFSVGSAYGLDGTYDGSILATEQGCIVVTMNYRVNLFGFMATEQIRSANGGTVGNFGVQDQQEALRWIKREIHAFGGDPNRVCLFGESAGAFSAIWHSVNRNSVKEDLFQSIIIQSPTADLSWYFQPQKSAINMYSVFSSDVGCPSSSPNQLECLQAIPAAELFQKWADWSQYVMENIGSENLRMPESAPMPLIIAGFGPVIDEHVDGLEDVPINLIKLGKFHNVPMITGITRDEGSVFALISSLGWTRTAPTNLLTQSRILDIISTMLPNPAVQAELFKLYPFQETWSPIGGKKFLDTLLMDFAFACSTHELIEHWSQKAPAWLYLFSAGLGSVHEAVLGAMHGVDLFYIFKTFPYGIIPFLRDHALSVSNEMSARWSALARFGNPNKHGRDWPEWKPFSESHAVLELGTPETMHYPIEQSDIPSWSSPERCQFWNRNKMPWAQMKPERRLISEEETDYLEAVRYSVLNNKAAQYKNNCDLVSVC